MVQPKYSPKESLERIKLMMKYDSTKTLNENFERINEQTKDTNLLTDQDLIGSTGWFRNWMQSVADFTTIGLPNVFDIVGINLPNLISGRRGGVKGVVDALDGFVDTKDLAYVLTVIKGLDGKCYYDDVEDKKMSATERFLELYEEDEDEDLKSEIEGVGIRTLKVGADKLKKLIIKAIDTQLAKGCSSDSIDKTKKDKSTDSEKSVVKKTTPKVTYTIPSELKDISGVQKFQQWLDTNKSGWHDKYGILGTDPARGYGTFGPRTNKAWNAYKSEYLNKPITPQNPFVKDTKVSSDDPSNV